MRVGQLGRTAIVARPGEGFRPTGGFDVAYPTGYPTLNRIRLWRVGAAGAATIARTSGNSLATLEPAATTRNVTARASAAGYVGAPRCSG